MVNSRRAADIGEAADKAAPDLGLACIIEHHRRWADRLGLLGRPWLVFGAAPDPTLPEHIIRQSVRVDVNSAGRGAALLGLGMADLTVRAPRKPWSEHPDLEKRGLLWFHHLPQPLLRLKLLTKPHRHVGSLRTMSTRERERLVTSVCGASLEGIGDLGKVTNGVAAACYGLALGVPQIILAGISLSKSGHAYDQLARVRMQIPEDGFVLTRLAGNPCLATSEPELAAQTGIRLVS